MDETNTNTTSNPPMPENNGMQNNLEQSKPSWLKNKTVMGIAGLILVVIIGAGGYFLVYASPGRVWEKFVSQGIVPANSSVKQDFVLSYQDNGQFSSQAQEENPYASMLEKIKLSLEGSAYVHSISSGSQESSGNFKYTFASGGTSLSAQFNVIIKGDDLYIKLGDIPLIGAMLSSFDSDKKVDWVKINLKDMRELSKQEGNGDSTMPDFNAQVLKYQQIVQKHVSKLVTIDKVLGKETVHNVKTIHFSNTVNKAEFKAMANEILETAINEAMAGQPNSTPEQDVKDKEMAMHFFNTIIDRVEIKNFETWIGISDSKIYRVKFTSSAPSLTSGVEVYSEISKDENLMADQQKSMDEFLKRISFQGEFNFNEELYDYGVTQEVKAPEGALDLVQQLKEQKEHDAQMMRDYELLHDDTVK